MTQYADWKAPKSDEAHLIWPAPKAIVSGTARNHDQLAACQSVRIQNTPLATLRADTRALIGAREEPVLVAGHQIEMYHPGVWVKNLVTDFASQKLSGRSVHLAVDTDTPKHLKLRWPGGAMHVSDDPAIVLGEWSGLVQAPSDAHRQKLVHAFNASAREWDFEPMIQPFLQTLVSDRSSDLCDLVLHGSAAIDASLGLQRQNVRLTELLCGDGFLAFAHQIGADIERFAQHYNAALADYRTEQKIDSRTRPMPDLLTTPQRIELPFWLDDLDAGTRIRAIAVRASDGWTLGGSPSFRFDPSLDAHEAARALREHLKQHCLRLAPRALTLTMFVRLLLADQFVHGIGGARYDQVTDRIIRSYFGIEAPSFSVATATLYFPGAGERTRECIPCMVSEGHRLRHNFSPAKPSLLAKVNAAPRKSLARKMAYVQMHRSLESDLPTAQAITQWHDRLERAREREEREQVLFDRELFFGVQSRERLTAMIERYRIAFA